MACAGFILAGAEKILGGGRIYLPPPVFVSAPPADFDSAPGAEQTRGGQKTFVHQKH